MTATDFDSKYIEVHGSRMHYLEAGSGDPLLFLHGNPTSSYLWRNIMPHIVPHARCIAPDLIGMGRSEKPDIAYRFNDHYRYLSKFIEILDLGRLLIVCHDWGSGLGFHYAYQHPDQVTALAFMEAIVRPMHWDQFDPQFKWGFKLMRTPFVGWMIISVMNAFVNGLLPRATIRGFSPSEMQAYREPFKTVRSRRPVRQWPCEIPIDGRPADVNRIVSDYSQWLRETDIPKLLFHVKPGGIINTEVLDWCRDHYKNLTTVDLGRGIHYVQEDHPREIGERLAEWYQKLKS